MAPLVEVDPIVTESLARLGRIGDLRAKLAEREDKPGFKRNAQALRAEIARLEQDASHGDPRPV